MAAEQQKQLVQVPFAAGIDERTRREHVDTARFQKLENVRQPERGAVAKRSGYQTVTSNRILAKAQAASVRPLGRKMLSFDGNPAVIDGEHLDVWSPTAQRWTAIDGVPNVLTKRRPLPSADSAANNTAPGAVAWVNGYVASFSAESFTRHWLTITDEVTGTVVLGPTLFTAVSLEPPQLAVVGTTLVVVVKTTSLVLNCYALDCSSVATIAAGYSAPVDRGSGSAGARWQIASSVDNTDRFVMVYQGASATTFYAMKVMNAAFTELVSISYNTTHVFTALAVSFSSAANRVYVANNRASGGFVDVQIHDGANGTGTLLHNGPCASMTYTAAAPLTVAALPSALSPPRCVVSCVGYVAGVEEMQIIWCEGVGAGITVTETIEVHQCRPASRLFIGPDGAAYVMVTPRRFTSEEQSAYLVRHKPDVSNYLQVVATLPRYLSVAGIAPLDQMPLCPAGNVSMGVHLSTRWLVQVKPKATSTNAASNLVTFDFAHQEQWNAARLGTGHHISGGRPSTYDGARVHEINFMHKPLSLTITGYSAGALNASIGWRYIAVWESVDAAGNLHQSQLSNPTTSTGAQTSKTVNLQVDSLPYTSRVGLDSSATVRLALYRTIDGGSTYYRQGAYTNDPTLPFVTIADTVGDSVLQTQAQLYRQIGVAGAPLNRQCPPCLRFLTLHREMLVGVGDDLVTLWHSGSLVPGEGVWFSDIFQIPVEEGGPITGLASVDGRLLVFKRDHIFVIDGEPPSDNGASGGFGSASRLPAQIGCVDSRSIVETPVGVFFRSVRGIELLSRSLQLSDVGQRVQATLAAFPITTSAVCKPSESLVLFTCVAVEIDSNATAILGNTGCTLVFDYEIGEWISVDRIGVNHWAMQSAALASLDGVNDVHLMLRWDGTVLAETPSTNLDFSNWVPMRAQTGWLKLGGLLGNQQLHAVQVLAEKATDHNLSVAIDYDYLSTRTQTATFTRAQIDASIAAVGRQQLDVLAGNNQMGSSARVTLTDATPTGGSVGTGRGATWIGIAFEGAASPGRRKVPVQSRGG